MIAGSIKSKEVKISVLIILFILAIVVLWVTQFMGASSLSWENILKGHTESIDFKIFWQMRIPRGLVAFMAGAVFAISGLVFQSIFRNPLVCSFTLGVSTGASFGATLYIWLGLPLVLLGIPGISIFAFFGAILSIAIIWSLTKIKSGASIAKMLLAGVVVSFFFMSLISTTYANSSNVRQLVTPFSLPRSILSKTFFTPPENFGS